MWQGGITEQLPKSYNPVIPVHCGKNFLANNEIQQTLSAK